MAFTNDDREKLTEVHTLVGQVLGPTVKDHEARLRKVEGTHLKVLGGATVISAFIGFFSSWFK